MTSEKKALPFPSIPRLYKVVIFLSFTTAHLRSTRSFWCVFINQINDAFFLLTFWNYVTFLSVLFMYFEIGVFKWRGRVRVGGGHITFHISTFSHDDCVFQWFWAHKKVHADSHMQRYRSSRPFFFPSTIWWDQICHRACSQYTPGGVAGNYTSLERCGWKNSEWN